MFSSIRSHYLYLKLQHEKGKKFIQSAENLARIRTEEAVRYLLEIIVSRDDLDNDEKSALAAACASVGQLASRYLLNEIYDEHGSLQYSVISALGSMKEREAVPIFIFLLEQTDDPIFAQSLGDIGDPEASTILRGKILNPESRCRVESLQALVRISAEDNADILALMMKSGDFIMQKKSAAALKKINYTFESEADRLIFNILTDMWEDVTVDTAEKARELSCFVNCHDVSFFRRIIDILAQSEFEQKPQVFSEFMATLNAGRLVYMFDRLPFFGDEPKLTDYFVYLSHNESSVRKAAEAFLSRQGKGVLTEALTQLFNSRYTDLLYQASLTSIAVQTGASRVAQIAKLLETPEEARRIVLLDILGTICDEKARKPIEKICRETENCEVLLYGIWALGQIGHKDSISLISGFIDHTDEEVRLAVYEALSIYNTAQANIQLQKKLARLPEGQEKETLNELIGEAGKAETFQ